MEETIENLGVKFVMTFIYYPQNIYPFDRLRGIYEMKGPVYIYNTNVKRIIFLLSDMMIICAKHKLVTLFRKISLFSFQILISPQKRVFLFPSHLDECSKVGSSS
jgi:hypothetical protein